MHGGGVWVCQTAKASGRVDKPLAGPSLTRITLARPLRALAPKPRPRHRPALVLRLVGRGLPVQRGGEGGKRGGAG